MHASLEKIQSRSAKKEYRKIAPKERSVNSSTNSGIVEEGAAACIDLRT